MKTFIITDYYSDMEYTIECDTLEQAERHMKQLAMDTAHLDLDDYGAEEDWEEHYATLEEAERGRLDFFYMQTLEQMEIKEV